MSLPAAQQRVLSRIETELEGGEPRLRSMFAIFTRLTRDDGAPRTESLRTQGWWTRPAGGLTGVARAVIAVPLVLGLLTLFVFMAINSSAVHGCRPMVHGAVRPASCESVQSVQQLPGHS